jgi:hypothetical protein
MECGDAVGQSARSDLRAHLCTEPAGTPAGFSAPLRNGRIRGTSVTVVPIGDAVSAAALDLPPPRRWFDVVE